MKNRVVAFDSRLRGFVLDLFDKKIDLEGFIVEKTQSNRREVVDGEPLRESDFGGVRKGSRIFFRSDISSLLTIADSLKK